MVFNGDKVLAFLATVYCRVTGWCYTTYFVKYWLLVVEFEVPIKILHTRNNVSVFCFTCDIAYLENCFSTVLKIKIKNKLLS